jgi:ribose transport system permease protein
VGGNQECARLSGVNVTRVKCVIYTINGALACVAGILVSFRLGSAQPDLGATYGLDAITACCLGGTAMGGGKGYMFGTVLGCIFLTSLSTGFNLMNVNTYLQQIIKGVVLVIAITFNSRNSMSFSKKQLKEEKQAA